MVGVAVNVTEVPAQIVDVEATIETAGTTEVETDICIAFEDTVEIVLQVALEVTSHVTISLLANVDEAKVLEFVPTLDPFIFH